MNRVVSMMPDLPMVNGVSTGVPDLFDGHDGILPEIGPSYQPPLVSALNGSLPPATPSLPRRRTLQVPELIRDNVVYLRGRDGFSMFEQIPTFVRA